MFWNISVSEVTNWYLVLNEIGEPTAVTARTQSSYTDESMGDKLLDGFKSIWGRA